MFFISLVRHSPPQSIPGMSCQCDDNSKKCVSFATDISYSSPSVSPYNSPRKNAHIRPTGEILMSIYMIYGITMVTFRLTMVTILVFYFVFVKIKAIHKLNVSSWHILFLPFEIFCNLLLIIIFNATFLLILCWQSLVVIIIKCKI